MRSIGDIAVGAIYGQSRSEITGFGMYAMGNFSTISTWKCDDDSEYV